MNRWNSRLLWTVLLCFLANILCFLDRLNLSIAAPLLMQQYGWNEAQMGVVLSGFFAGYVIFMIPGGVLADRYGANKVLAAGVGIWSLFTALTPLFSRLGTLFACRTIIGAAQGVNFPCINNLIAQRIPMSDRAKVMGFTLSGVTIGAMIGFPVGSWIVQTWGWPAMFYVFGALGLFWMVGWIRLAPESASPGTEDPLLPREPIPWRRFFSHRSSVGLALSYFCHNYSGYLFLVWLPTYLIQVHGFSITGTGIGAALPALTSAVFMNVSGWLSDYLIKRGRSREFSRRILLSSGMSLAGVCLLGVVWASSAYTALALFALSAAAKSIATPVYWTLSVDMAPRHAGILSSIMNTSGNLAGIVASTLTGWTVAYFGGWNPAIILAGAVTLLGVVIAVPTIRSAEIV